MRKYIRRVAAGAVALAGAPAFAQFADPGEINPSVLLGVPADAGAGTPATGIHGLVGAVTSGSQPIVIIALSLLGLGLVLALIRRGQTR